MLINQYADILNPPNGPTLHGIGGLGALPELSIPASFGGAGLVQKVMYYLDRRNEGYTDEELRAAATRALGPQSDFDWNALQTLADVAQAARRQWDYSRYLSQLSPAQRLLAQRSIEQGSNFADALLEAFERNDYTALASLTFLDGITRELYSSDGFEYMKNLSNHYGVPIVNYGQDSLPPVPVDAIKADENAAIAQAINTRAAILMEQREQAAAEEAARLAAEIASEGGDAYQKALALQAELMARQQAGLTLTPTGQTAEEYLRATAEAAAAAEAARPAEAARLYAIWLEQARLDNQDAIAKAQAAYEAALRAANEKTAAANAAAEVAAASAAAAAAAAAASKRVVQAAATAADKVTGDLEFIPTAAELALMSVAEKVALYRSLVAKGWLDARIRAAIESVVGPQLDADWSALVALSEAAQDGTTATTTPAPVEGAAAAVVPIVLATAAYYFLGL